MDFATARKRVGMNQTDLAKAIDVSSGTVGHWESGDFMPSPRHIPRLATVLTLTPDEVLALTPSGKHHKRREATTDADVCASHREA